MQKILYGALFLVTILVATSAPTPVTFEKTFGGKDDDLAKAVVETSDGYLIAGKSKSFSSHRDFDAYLIKIDHNGNKVWSKTYGGTRDEDANDIINYGMGAVFVGSTKTFGNQDKSFYINRISKKGSHIWRKAYFLDGDDEYTGSSIVTDGRSLTIAGTELHLGFTTSDVSPLVLQTNGGGKRIWEHYLGGRKKDFANKIIYTGDGYLVVGKTESYGHGDFDMYMIKLNKKGKWQWYNAFGGGDDDTANDVIQMNDGGYLLVGSTNSFGLTRDDVLIVKTDKDGKRLWQRNYGGNYADEAYAIARSPDGGFVIAGRTESFNRRNGFDLYLFKIDAHGKLIWQRTHGGKSDDAGYDIITTRDGYLIVGEKKSDLSRDSNVWVLKVDFNGKLR